jgi:hypothetical protein
MRAPAPARLLLAALACLALAACGGSSGGDDPAAAPATTAAATTVAASKACADAAALKASLAELNQMDPPKAGKDGVQAALEKVRTNLAALKTSAGSQWSAQVTELDGAVAAFQTTVAGVDGNSLLGDLQAIIEDLERVDSAWTDLQHQIDKDCG